MFTHSVGISYKNDAGTITNTTDVYMVDAEVNLDEVVPAGSLNKEYDIKVTVAQIQCMVMMSSQNVTVKTNSTTTPGDTINLIANKQLVWTRDHVEAKFLSVDVTKMYVTDSGG